MRTITKALAPIMAVLLSGCPERSLTGHYLLVQPATVEYIQLTQTEGQDLVGSLQSAELTKDGQILTSTFNLSGVIDGDTLTLTLSKPPNTIGMNLGGSITSDGLSLLVPSSPNSVHINNLNYKRASLSEYDVALDKLKQTGLSIIAQHQQERQKEALNRDAESLTQRLNDFVVLARKRIDRGPRVVAYYARASADTQEKLAAAQHLAFGNDMQKNRSQVIINQMQVDMNLIAITDNEVESALKEDAGQETSLNIGIQRFTGNCLGSASTIKEGDVIPDMGPCKSLFAAVVAYNAVLGPLHSSHNAVRKAKDAAELKLKETLRSASRLQ